ncbi:MAG: PQQ-binding-like beta-propeller repeat protein [Bacteroidetes bacterium]|nr:PQQ-binding-like beta-propeller repeat protein [Bacteroidota bacterium]
MIVFLFGCGKSLIKITAKLDSDPYPMFGRTSARNFYVPVTVSDSLVLNWENDVHGSFTNSSVTIYDEYVFTSDLGGRIYVFDINDGSKVGMLKSKDAIYSAPLIFKSVVVYAVAEEKYNLTELIIYNFKTGKEVFYEEIYSRVLSEMIALEDGIIFLTESGRINRYDLSGKSIWQTETDVTTRCSPSLKNGIIIFGNDDGEVITVDLEDGEIINRKSVGGIFTGTPTIDDSIAYMSNNNGMIYALDLKSIEIIWQHDTHARILMSPAVDDKNVIIGNLSGSLFSLNKFNGKPNWKQQYKGVFQATPLLTNYRIIIPDLFRSLYIIDKSTGIPNKIYLLEGRAKLSPVYFDGILFIGFDRGILRAYEFVY